MKKSGKIILSILSGLFVLGVLVCAGIAGVRWIRHEERQNRDLEALQDTVGFWISQWEKPQPEVQALREDQMKKFEEFFSSVGNLNAWQKLACGEDICLLIVGDSIGAMKWTNDVAKWIEENYLVNCDIKNISLGSNTSYSGFVSEKILDDGVAYDLVIVCYGQNDVPQGFAADYEALIREVLTKNEMPCVISVLESAQREYTEKMQDILRIADHYGLLIADTIDSFENSGYSYEALTADGIHPNEIGQGIYAETVKEVIRTRVAEEFDRKMHLVQNAMLTGESFDIDAYRNKPSLPMPLDATGILPYSSFRYYPSDEFTRISDTEWEIHFDVPQTGLLGISRSRCYEGNRFEIYRNNELYYYEEDYLRFGFNLMKISKISESVDTFQGDLRIRFLQKEHADSFFGIIFTDYKEAN